MKKVLVLGASVAMLFSFTLQAEAGFNLGGIANKVANKAVDSVLSGGKKQTNANTNKQSSTDKQQTKTKDTVQPQTTGNKARDNVDGSRPTAWVGTLDPLPPDAVEDRPDWFDNRTHIWAMTNGRLVAEYENMDKWRAYAKQNGLGWVEPDMFRYEELGKEIRDRIRAIERYENGMEIGTSFQVAESPEYKRAVGSNIEPLRKYDLRLDSTAILIGYHPERN